MIGTDLPAGGCQCCLCAREGQGKRWASEVRAPELLRQLSGEAVPAVPAGALKRAQQVRPWTRTSQRRVWVRWRKVGVKHCTHAGRGVVAVGAAAAGDGGGGRAGACSDSSSGSGGSGGGSGSTG